MSTTSMSSTPDLTESSAPRSKTIKSVSWSANLETILTGSSPVTPRKTQSEDGFGNLHLDLNKRLLKDGEEKKRRKGECWRQMVRFIVSVLCVQTDDDEDDDDDEEIDKGNINNGSSDEDDEELDSGRKMKRKEYFEEVDGEVMNEDPLDGFRKRAMWKKRVELTEGFEQELREV